MEILHPLSITTIILIISQTNCRVTNNHENKHFHGRVTEFVQRRCLLNSDGKQLDKALAELHSIKQCFKKKFPTHTEEDNEGLQERCYEMRKQIKECMKRLMDFIEPCLDRDEKYLPEFILESYEGFSDYFCGHINMLTLHELIQSKMAKCINTFNKNPDIDPTKVCFENSKLTDHEDTSVSKEELCNDLNQIYECYERQFKEHCADSPKAWEFESGLLNGIRSPCKAET